ncbi:MAG: glucosamine-6-phosphate deaminase [Verrucomicrobia bacterium]|nr:glucosamine-6-phosphate deaminase [Verrucomicrobiota bacterium]MCF7709240.1 glucosamine-6-phosphate deaminase [Verrucomicrobiota bacterium]
MLKQFKTDSLDVRVYNDRNSLGAAAAAEAAEHLERVLSEQDSASVIFATGNSQNQFLEHLGGHTGIDWSRITCFHMDEYLGIDAEHKASFRRFLKEKIEKPFKPKVFHYIEGDAMQPIAECERYTELLVNRRIDLCCLGVGENGHIAFNDPDVAAFNDRRTVKIVKLDMKCRQQQVGEGHFPHLHAVPQYALTLTIPALCAAERMLCIAPEQRKADAVKTALEGEINERCPASILRRHQSATLFLDTASAGELESSER